VLLDRIEEAIVAEPASNVAGTINPDRSFDITDVSASDGVAVGGGVVELRFMVATSRD